MDISEFSRLRDKASYLRHPWETSRVNVLKTFLRSSGISFPVDRVVDIGGGDAFVINSLMGENLAREYFAIDTAYTQEVIGQLKENYNDSGVQYVHDLEEYNRQHDAGLKTLFLCMDVLEHLEDESIILDHLDPRNTNCHYFFSVPAFQSVFSSHDVLLGHYRRYTLSQFEKMLKNKGFTIKNRGYYFTSLLALRWVEKLFKKKKDESIDNWEGGKTKTKLINSVLDIDFRISLLLKKAGIIIPGLSCYCLCKK
ncbi:hypothetical protein OGH69_09245 [Flavobacterium sp. MFBS3-15]|uniref:class I SAM-dependent methyltransferase n=1 Tax=Flavobacterium sp. MFBS3-15 TaxID=2989816 RepID=UPI002235900C|nr:hypothetical protein [Flavobacterium sp. MFBS3-15]MCW4469148.1 hypothetical protein [Flavobacterium sp. MFBS3-15]